MQLVCNDSYDILSGGACPLNCLEIVVTCPTIRKNPGCATDSWPGHFRNPTKKASDMLLRIIESESISVVHH